jgi:hypothetical protein
MVRLNVITWILIVGVFMTFNAEAQDRVASIGNSSPDTIEVGTAGVYDKLVDIVRALDRDTHSSTKIVLRPFARSLKETAAGHADFHIPLIQDGDAPAPEGLVYVTEVDFGHAQFVIYSRKIASLDARTVAGARTIETEPGHESLFPFPVTVTHCVPCSLDKVLLGRTEALIVSSDVVDPLLSNPKYKGIHRALYKMYPIRALVPANADSAATRRYLIDGVKHLKETGELWKIIQSNLPYSDWQP